jgi:nucleotide-binding universal stress UspA family protein
VLADRAGAADCLTAAREAALALPGATLAALHVRPDPETTIIPSEEILTPRQREQLRLAAESEAAALHALFSDWRARQAPGVEAAWRDVAGDVPREVARIGRDAALLVMAAPGPHAKGRAAEAFRAALFDTHRPLLRIAPGAPVRPPRRIAIGWKDSEVCRRAIAAATPWLRRAERVDVLHAVARDAAELAAADRLLTGIGIVARLHPLDPGPTPVGAQLLAEAAALDADWLLIGAYRHPPLAEWLLGGVTRLVLQVARLPVLLMH